MPFEKKPGIDKRDKRLQIYISTRELRYIKRVKKKLSYKSNPNLILDAVRLLEEKYEQEKKERGKNK